MRKSAGVAMAAIMLVATSIVGEAHAACWTAEEVSAASIRDLQSLMMVATLRCQAAGVQIAGDYNGFLRANKATIQQMNDRLKAHFIRASGPVAGQRDYDSFTTTLANGYGAGATNGEVCGGIASLAREAEMMAGSAEGLLLLAERQGVATSVPGDICQAAPVVVAVAAPPADPPAPRMIAQAQVVAVATAPSTPAAVTLAVASSEGH